MDASSRAARSIPALASSPQRLRRQALGVILWLGLASNLSAASVPEVVAAARPSVLPVGTFSATDSPRFGFRGSGFVVGDGTMVVTNFHVLPANVDTPGGPRMAVLLPQGPDRPGEVRGARLLDSDRNHDLALLKIDGPALPALTLGAAALSPEGTAVVLLGFPIGGVLGFAPVTHRGIVSSLTRIALPAVTAQQLTASALARIREGPFEIYQLDAVAYPGNSGGPLLNAETGQVIGVVNMVLVRGTRESALSNPTGITYAIPAKFIRDLIGQR